MGRTMWKHTKKVEMVASQTMTKKKPKEDPYSKERWIKANKLKVGDRIVFWIETTKDVGTSIRGIAFHPKQMKSKLNRHKNNKEAARPKVTARYKMTARIKKISEERSGQKTFITTYNLQFSASPVNIFLVVNKRINKNNRNKSLKRSDIAEK